MTPARVEWFDSTSAVRTAIPIHRGADERWYTLMSVGPLDDLRDGEVLDVFADIELTNNLPAPMQFSVVGRLILATGIDVTPSSPRYDGAGVEQWRWLTAAGGGRNLSGSELVHHDVIQRAGILRVDRPYGQRRVNFCVKCVTSDPKTAGRLADYEGTDCAMVVRRWSPS